MKTEIKQALLSGLIVLAALWAVGCAGGFVSQADAYRIISGERAPLGASEQGVAVINGIACHETGCPASKRPWVEIDGYLIPGGLPHEIYGFDEVDGE